MKQNGDLQKMTSLALTSNPRETNRETVLAFVEAEGEGITLTAKQQQLHDDWVMVDDILRTNVGKKKRGELISLIMEKCNVSRSTAFNYVIDAQYVFGSLTKIDKQYFIQNRMEFLERQIKLCADAGDHKAAANYEKSLTKYVEMYPDNRKNESPRTLLLMMGKKEDIQQMPTEEAEYIVMEALNKLPDAITESTDTEQADTAESQPGESIPG